MMVFVLVILFFAFVSLTSCLLSVSYCYTFFLVSGSILSLFFYLLCSISSELNIKLFRSFISFVFFGAFSIYCLCYWYICVYLQDYFFATVIRAILGLLPVERLLFCQLLQSVYFVFGRGFSYQIFLKKKFFIRYRLKIYLL